jgi:acetyltransferase-like isoleucine patch superfamily enzyme
LIRNLTSSFPNVEFGEGCIVYDGVFIGGGSVVRSFVVLGIPPRGCGEGELETRIGKSSIIRPFTTIYAGTTVGDFLETGQGASIREENVILDNVSVGTNSVLEFGNRIGRNVRIHSNCFLEMVTIEDDVFIGPGVVFTDDPHPMGCPKYKECAGGATVRSFARIGAGTVVLPGVNVGRNSLVGAGSLVVEDVPDDTVVAGHPARILKRVDELVCKPGFFEKPYVWPPYQKKGEK